MKKIVSRFGIVICCVLVLTTATITAFAAVGAAERYDPKSFTPSNAKTTAGVTEYIYEINSQNAQLSTVQMEDVITTITFSRSMTANDLEAYVEAYDIEIVQLQARGYDKYGNRITFFSRTDKGLEETFRMLNELAESDGVEFAGAIGLYALTDSMSVSAIQNDERTLLIDTSTDQYYNNGATEKERNANASSEEVSRVFANSIAWDAEDVGIVQYDVAK